MKKEDLSPEQAEAEVNSWLGTLPRTIEHYLDASDPSFFRSLLDIPPKQRAEEVTFEKIESVVVQGDYRTVVSLSTPTHKVQSAHKSGQGTKGTIYTLFNRISESDDWGDPYNTIVVHNENLGEFITKHSYAQLYALYTIGGDIVPDYNLPIGYNSVENHAISGTISLTADKATVLDLSMTGEDGQEVLGRWQKV